MFRRSFVCWSTSLDKAQVKALVAQKLKGQQKNTMLVDVRAPTECQELGMIPTSINIPLQELDRILQLGNPAYFKKTFNCAMPDPDVTSFVFYCAHGVRSTYAMSIAQGHAYQSFAHYRGGFNEWSQDDECEVIKVDSGK